VVGKISRLALEITALWAARDYFYDAEAVKEPTVSLDPETSMRSYNPAGRNLRNVWRLPPAPFPEARFATFPSELPRRCIMAGTGERGVCPKCGAKTITKQGESYGSQMQRFDNGFTPSIQPNRPEAMWQVPIRCNLSQSETETIGWHPTCSCDAGDPVPATVLDPFLGAGTTALVADQLQRHCIGIDLSPKYAEMARKRIASDIPLFADIAAE
jgi:hypothetical protein